MLGKGLLILVGAATFLGIYASLGTGSNLVETEAALAKDEFEVLARNAALAGLNLATQQMSEDFNDAGTFQAAALNGNYENYVYTASVEPMSSSRVILRSRGRALTARNDTMDFTTRAEYKAEAVWNDPDRDIPPSMRQAVNGGGDVFIEGSFDAEAYDDGFQAEGLLNANVHANGIINPSGAGARVAGFGYYAGNASVLSTSQMSKLNSIFNPGYNPTNADAVTSADPVDIPAFDVAWAAEIPSYVDLVIAGDVNSNAIDFTGIEPTAANPYVIYIAYDPSTDYGGNLHLNSGTIPDYTIFLIDGDMTTNGEVIMGTPNSPDGKSTVAFYIDGDLRTNGETELWGQFYVNDTVAFGNGNVDLYGSLTAVNDMTLSGSLNLFYREANAALYPDPNFEVVITRVTYSEW